MNDSYQELDAERNHNGMYFEYQLSTICDDDDEDEDEDDDDDDDDDTVIVTINAKVNSFSPRQLKFKKIQTLN